MQTLISKSDNAQHYKSYSHVANTLIQDCVEDFAKFDPGQK